MLAMPYPMHSVPRRVAEMVYSKVLDDGVGPELSRRPRPWLLTE
jgi:hypothetical protein